MLKMNAVKSKKAKALIEKSYDAKILKLAADSKPLFSNINNALTGYTMGFAKVKSPTVFGAQKSKLSQELFLFRPESSGNGKSRRLRH